MLYTAQTICVRALKNFEKTEMLPKQENELKVTTKSFKLLYTFHFKILRHCANKDDIYVSTLIIKYMNTFFAITTARGISVVYKRFLIWNQ